MFQAFIQTICFAHIRTPSLLSIAAVYVEIVVLGRLHLWIEIFILRTTKAGCIFFCFLPHTVKYFLFLSQAVKFSLCIKSRNVRSFQILDFLEILLDHALKIAIHVRIFGRRERLTCVNLFFDYDLFSWAQNVPHLQV